ncbi:MAG: diguanylate cyclase [Nitrospirae bacterium]|nr:diguanylate cyclase [Nitrospirota bacterium]
MTKTIFNRIFNFMTFTDIPIWQKLLLFAGGGIAWFIIIALIGLGAITYVNDSSKALTEQVVPHIQASQKLIIQIRGANVSVHNIAIHDEVQIVNDNSQRARDLLSHVAATLDSLLKGGKIRDYSDLTGELIAEFQVVSINNVISMKNVEEVQTKIPYLFNLLDEIITIKLKGLQRGELSLAEKDLFMKKLREYDSLTVQSVTILSKLTSSISALQKQYTEKIDIVLSRSMVMFIVIGILAVSLLILFSYLLKTSMTKPIKAITEQIKVLSEGEVDLTKQITIGSNDEIAELSSNFNMLMQTIYDMNTFKKVIEEDDSLEDVYSRLAKVFYENLGLDDFSILEAAERKNIMELIHTPYSREEICCNKEILIDSNLCRAKKTGHTVSSIIYPEICKQYLLAPEKFHICIPVIVGGSIGGVIQFQFDKFSNRENEKPTPILNASCMAKQILKAEQYIKESSAVIETKRLTGELRESSVRDQMTGLYNRRFLEEYVETLIAGIMRKGGQIGLLMCDLDFFKEVNDKYGHDAGDAVLKETTKVISKNARSADLVIRFGGEEFLVIVNDAKPGEAEEVAERIRKKIAATKIKTSGQVIQKTISIGYCEFPRDTQNFWEAIKYADIALYKAKEAGRNKVLKFGKEMWTTEAY